MHPAWAHRGRVDSSSSSSSSSSASLFSSSLRSSPQSDIFKRNSLELDVPSDRHTTSDDDGSDSSSSTSEDDDDDDYNKRLITPCWEAHRQLLQRRGFRLDTYRDVKKFYERYWADAAEAGQNSSTGSQCPKACRNCNALVKKDCSPRADIGTAAGYVRACKGGREGCEGEDGLCRDAGLVRVYLLRHANLSLTTFTQSPTISSEVQG